MHQEMPDVGVEYQQVWVHLLSCSLVLHEVVELVAVLCKYVLQVIKEALFVKVERKDVSVPVICCPQIILMRELKHVVDLRIGEVRTCLHCLAVDDLSRFFKEFFPQLFFDEVSAAFSEHLTQILDELSHVPTHFMQRIPLGVASIVA